MGVCASSSSKPRDDDHEEGNPAQKQSSQGTALVVFLGNDHQQERQQKWKVVSNTAVSASEFPNHVVSEASALWPDKIIWVEAPASSSSLYQLRYGEIFYAIPVSRLGTVFTNDDLRSLMQRSLDAMDDSPSFALSKLHEDEPQHSSGPKWDSEMPFLKISTKSYLSPVAECDSESEGY